MLQWLRRDLPAAAIGSATGLLLADFNVYTTRLQGAQTLAMFWLGHAAAGAVLALIVWRTIYRRRMRKHTPPLAIHQAAMRRQMARWAIANMERSKEQIADLLLSTEVVVAIVPEGAYFAFFAVKGRKQMRKLALAATSCEGFDQKIDYENGALLINRNVRATFTAIACGSFRMAQELTRIAEQRAAAAQSVGITESFGPTSPVAARLRMAAEQQPQGTASQLQTQAGAEDFA